MVLEVQYNKNIIDINKNTVEPNSMILHYHFYIAIGYRRLSTMTTMTIYYNYI